jgi:hypothetical protein
MKSKVAEKYGVTDELIIVRNDQTLIHMFNIQ